MSTCGHCGTAIDLTDGTWVDGTDGDCCWAETNENQPHTPERTTMTERCDSLACHNPATFVTRGYLADGSAPTWNMACSSHAGDVAANYLRTSDKFVRSSIERVEQPAYVIVGEDGLFWHNHYGWVDRAHADEFTATEHEDLSLPIGGAWSPIERTPE